MLFGDVGGLYDFLSLGLATFFGFFSDRFLQASLVQKLYRGVSSNNHKNPYKGTNISLRQNMLTPCAFTPWIIVSQAFKLSCCLSPGGKKALHRRALSDGTSRIEDSLDVVKLIRQGHALTVLMRLLLTRDARRLIRI